jgi:hypothetical protein
MLEKIFSFIPAVHNWISDKDFIWWPFSFLKPSPATPITFQLTLQMTACFGGLSFIMYVGFTLFHGIFSLSSAFYTLILCLVGFFSWFNLITKPLWNYRARRLKK